MLDSLTLGAADVVMVTRLAAGLIHPRNVEHARTVKLRRKPKLTDHQKRKAIKRRQGLTQDQLNEALCNSRTRLPRRLDKG
jgi:hypothetical protein